MSSAARVYKQKQETHTNTHTHTHTVTITYTVAHAAGQLDKRLYVGGVGAIDKD